MGPSRWHFFGVFERSVCEGRFNSMGNLKEARRWDVYSILKIKKQFKCIKLCSDLFWAIMIAIEGAFIGDVAA